MADDPHNKTTPLAWTGQILLYGLFALIVGVFSSWPPYKHLPADRALIKVSVSHQAKPVGECRKLTPEELAKLPPNMRKPIVCPRERSPISVELDIDGQPALRRVAQPSGLSKDGAAAMYHRMEVAAGTHRVAVRLKDDARTPGFDYQRDAVVTLRPAQILVIDFDPSAGGITLQ
jgi:hypothetical protein